MTIRMIFAVPILLAAGIAGAQAQNVTDAIYESTVRYVIDVEGRAKGIPETGAICVSIDEQTDNYARPLLLQLTKITPLIHQSDQCEFDEPRRLLVEKQERRPALALKLSKVLWLEKDEVVVTVQHYRAPLDGSLIAYVLKKSETGWSVVRKRLQWIS